MHAGLRYSSAGYRTPQKRRERSVSMLRLRSSRRASWPAAYLSRLEDVHHPKSGEQAQHVGGERCRKVRLGVGLVAVHCQMAAVKPESQHNEDACERDASRQQRPAWPRQTPSQTITEPLPHPSTHRGR